MYCFYQTQGLEFGGPVARFFRNIEFGWAAQILDAVGLLLRFLSVKNPGDSVDTGMVLQYYPNLGLFAVEFWFDEYRATTVSSSCLWEDAKSLATKLSGAKKPLVKCVRQLRIRLWVYGEDDDRPYKYDHVHAGLDALLAMLDTNHYLQYLEVKVFDEAKTIWIDLNAMTAK